MAKEIKTIQVSTALEAQTIQDYQCFGWTLLNNQEVYVKDSHLESGLFDKKIYSVTETTHYAKLTFERDPAKLENYQQLRQLENAYHAVPKPSKKPQFLPMWAFVLIGCFVGFMMLMGLLADELAIGIIPAVILALPAYLWQRMCQVKMHAWEAEYREYRAKCEQIIEQADQLC